MKTLLNLIILIIIIVIIIFSAYIYSVNTGKTKNRLHSSIRRRFIKYNLINLNELAKTTIADTNELIVEPQPSVKKITDFLNDTPRLSGFKKKYFAQINIVENDMLFEHALPVISDKYLVIPRDWITKINGGIVYAGTNAVYKVLAEDIKLNIAIVEIDTKFYSAVEDIELKNILDNRIFNISDELEIIGFKNNAVYHKTIISAEVSNEFDYKFLGNYIIQQNFDKNMQYLVIVNDRIEGIVNNGIFLTNYFLNKTADYYKDRGSEAAPVMQFDLNVSINNILSVGKNTVSGINSGMIIENINGYKVYNINQFKNLLFDALIFGKKIMVNNLIDVSAAVDFNASLLRFTDFECSGDTAGQTGQIKITRLKADGSLNRFGIKTGDNLKKINDISIESRRQLIELFYYNNLKIETIEIQTSDNIDLKIKFNN